MAPTGVPDQFIFLSIVVWWLDFVIPGKAYRFLGGNYCTHIASQSQESQFLQDDDMTTCELIQNDTEGTFGLYIKEPRRRLFLVDVYGKEIHCSPVYGISLAIVSTDRESHACKAYFTESVHSCKYECQCPQDKTCSHITITIFPTAFADEMLEICEINVWIGSHWD